MNNKAKLSALKNVVKKKDNTILLLIGGAVVLGGVYLLWPSPKKQDIEKVYRPLVTEIEYDEYNSLRKKVDLSEKERKRLNYLLDRINGKIN